MRAFVFLTILFAAACATEATDEEDEGETSSAATNSGYAAADQFDKTGVSHSIEGSGVIVTKTRDNQPITTYDAFHVPLSKVSLDDGPSDGPIRISTLEKLEVDGKTMFRVWPGGASKQGWIELDDVRTGSVTVKEEKAARAGNGQACGKDAPALTTAAGKSASYTVTPKSILPTGNDDTRWKLQSSTGPWYVFHPDWDQPGGIDRVFLMWSWTRTSATGLNDDFKGGGVVRTEMRAGTSFTPCKVQPIRTILRETPTASGSKPKSGARTLAVYAAYGKTSTPAHDFYGWTIVASRLGDTCQMHVSCKGGEAECPRLPLPESCQF